MKTLVICGSRNLQGQTAQATKAVVTGLTRAGASVEQVFLPVMNIERCRQCEDNGWGLCLKEGRCVINDDLHQLVETLREADTLVITTPVYFGDLSESLRAFTDRLRRICRNEQGRQSIQGKPMLGVCVAGGGGGGAPTCCVSLEKTLTHSGIDVLDMIPVRRQNLQEKLPRLELAGEWFVLGTKKL